MQRYFLKYSYLGTHFRGLQQQPGEIFDQDCPYKSSIQTLLERGLARFGPANTPQVVLSSRTDKGVHAICTSAHFDLEHVKEGEKYPPERLIKGLTRYMEKCNASILIRDIKPVPDTFNARHSALFRTYLYRIGVTTNPGKYPVAEWRRCHFVSEPFCLDKAVEACKVIRRNGEQRNFASFCHGYASQHPKFNTTRNLDVLDIKEGRPLLNSQYDPLYEGIRFLDINVKGRAFLYKQVRRMVGVITAVAQNRMKVEEIDELFSNPGTWNSRALTAPPCGLYLLDVAYDQLPVPENVKLE